MLNTANLKALQTLGRSILYNKTPIVWGDWKNCLFGQYAKANDLKLFKSGNYRQAQEQFGISQVTAERLFAPIQSRHLRRGMLTMAAKLNPRFGVKLMEAIPGNGKGKRHTYAARQELYNRLKIVDRLVAEAEESDKSLNGVLKDIGTTQEKNVRVAECA